MAEVALLNLKVGLYLTTYPSDAANENSNGAKRCERNLEARLNAKVTCDINVKPY